MRDLEPDTVSGISDQYVAHHLGAVYARTGSLLPELRRNARLISLGVRRIRPHFA